MENPEFFLTNYYNAQFTTDKRLFDHPKNNDHFIIEDLLNLPNDDGMLATDDALESAYTTTAADSCTATPVDTSTATEPYFHSADTGGPRGLADGHFSDELFVPYDDMAELEWLSTFVDEPFESEDLQKLHLIEGIKA